MAKYKVGDVVTFYKSFELAGESLSNLGDDWEVPYGNCDVTKDMLLELDRWFDSQIVSIDEDGDIKFEDFPYTWPVEVISGHSPDYLIGEDGLHNVRRVDGV